jgi:hypothetical protein
MQLRGARYRRRGDRVEAGVAARAGGGMVWDLFDDNHPIGGDWTTRVTRSPRIRVRAQGHHSAASSVERMGEASAGFAVISPFRTRIVSDIAASFARDKFTMLPAEPCTLRAGHVPGMAHHKDRRCPLFPAKPDMVSAPSKCPLCAKSRHQPTHSITSSATASRVAPPE